MNDDTRRARAQWRLEDARGASLGHGEAEAVIDGDGLHVGTVSAAFLDADELRAADYRIELGLWPSGRLSLSALGRRFDTFAASLRSARNRARVAGLLAHAPAPPEVFSGTLLQSAAAEPVELLVFATHLTIVPDAGDPWQIPLGALDDVSLVEDPPGVALLAADAHTRIGGLGRRRDTFRASVLGQRDAQAQLLARYTGRRGFADGLGLPRDRVSDFEALLGHCSSPERLEGAQRLLGLASGDEPRIGFVQLLDRDAELLQARVELPENWASFLLVPVRDRVAFEILSGPSAATYVFEGRIDALNRDLQQLHFRRAALALSDAAAVITPENPHRLALRRLVPLQRLRAATRARVIHDERWSDALGSALARA